MDAYQDFQKLGSAQLTIQQGIEDMQRLRAELERNRLAANAWGFTAVMANAVLIPLNVIVNALELGAAKSAYQVVVRALYDKFGKSGSRTGGPSKQMLEVLRQAVVQELRRKGMTDMVPGVNIIVGLAQDSIGLWQTVATVDAGGREMTDLARQIDRQIADAIRRLQALGVQRAELLQKLQRASRTA